MKPFLCALSLLLSVAAISQKNIDPTAEDVQLAKKLREQYLKDDIAILSSNEDVSFGLDSKNAKVTVRNGVSQVLMNINQRADISKYEFYDSQSKIETFSLTYRNEKTANFYIADEFYKDKDLFYNDARVKHMSVDFPVQGYTYNYQMEKKYDDVKYFTSVYFNEEFPVLKKKITITVPDWLNVELKEFNFDGHNIVKSKTADAKNHSVTYTYSSENIPGFYDEPNAPGKSYIYPHIIVVAKSFKGKAGETTIFSSSADLYKWYKSLVDMMHDRTEAMAEKVKELTANAKSDEEKIKNIYYWVQDNIRYIAFEDGIAGFKPDESNNVFEKRYGDCKGMANLTKQMLKLAGFDARLSWIGTKHISYDYTTPSLAVDNHMICTLLHDGKKYYLDGTEKYNSFGEYADRIQNKEVMIEDGDKCIIEKIPASPVEANRETFSASLSVENEKLTGHCSKSAIGESRAEFLYIYNNFENDKKGLALEKYSSGNDKNIHVSAIKTSDLKNRDQKLTVDYDITIDNKISGFENDMYIDLEYMNEFRNFTLKDRKTDYEFNYKKNYESAVTLKIPAGYAVKKLPESMTVKEPDYEIAISYAQAGDEIVYKKSFTFKKGVIKANEKDKWNAINKSLNNLYNQQIVLTKQ
jgi:hypothetical protein